MMRLPCLLVMLATVQSAALAAAMAPPAGDQPATGKPAIQSADRSAQIAAFLADPDGKQPHDVPAWNEYRKTVGEDKVARALFIEMLKAQPNLCAAIGGDPKR